MSRERQPPTPPGATDEGAILVRSLALRLPSDHHIEAHRHDWDQLVYATDGVMTVSTALGSWVVPSRRAVWIPAGELHDVRMTGRVRMRTLYVRPDLARDAPRICCVLSVSPLLRELVLEVIARKMLHDQVRAERNLAAVLLDQIRATPEAPLRVVWPKDARALKAAECVFSAPAENAPLSEFARGSGASARTLERVFKAETGMSFGRWRQQVRLVCALRRLAAGESVTSTALAVGFSGTSAFSAMFRRALGATPSAYMRDEASSARE